MESVLCTLSYKPHRKPKEKVTAFIDRERFTRAVSSLMSKIVVFDSVTLDDDKGLRHFIWFRSLSIREAEAYHINKMWDKGAVHLTEIDDESEDSIERMFKFMKERSGEDD